MQEYKITLREVTGICLLKGKLSGHDFSLIYWWLLTDRLPYIRKEYWDARKLSNSFLITYLELHEINTVHDLFNLYELADRFHRTFNEAEQINILKALNHEHSH